MLDQADVLRISSPATRAARLKLTTLRALVPHQQFADLDRVVPSYVAAAIRALDAALVQWQRDETLIEQGTAAIRGA